MDWLCSGCLCFFFNRAARASLQLKSAEVCTYSNVDSTSVKENIVKLLLNLTEMKRKGSISSFFSPKRKAREIVNELSKVDGEDEVEGEREDEERDKIQGQGDQGQEEVGEDEEGKRQTDRERERRVPGPTPTISSRAGPHGMETVDA